MENIAFPFLVYYWLWAKLLPVGEWVIVSGFGVLVVTRIKLKAFRFWLSNQSSLVRKSVYIAMMLGAVGTMPSAFLYGAKGVEVGKKLGGILDAVIPGSLGSFILITCFAVISVMAMMAWAIVLWGCLGFAVGLVLNIAIRARAS